MKWRDTSDLQDHFHERKTTGAGARCPDEDRIWLALQGGLSREETFQVIKHTGSCSVCAGTWRLAHGLGAMEEGGAVGEQVEEPTVVALKPPWLAQTVRPWLLGRP